MTLEQANQQLNIVVDLIPAGRPNRNGRPMAPTSITIHNTANADRGADALMHARYLKGGEAAARKVAWHFTVDDQRVVKHLPTRERGMHAADPVGNATSIGIEICENQGIDHDAANRRAALLTALLLKSFNLNRDAIRQHHDWPGAHGKDCPHLLRANDNAGWRHFLELVGEFLQLMDGAGVSMHSASALLGTRVRAQRAEVQGRTYALDARPDTPDFRDALFEPTLVNVPPGRSLTEYRQVIVPVLDQGQEGACTGFGLATVVNYLLRTRIDHCADEVSPRMLYEMARKYDEFPGEAYSGSSARGAMKGWHKHGVCTAALWPYHVNDSDGILDSGRADDARGRPLGAYYRVNHKDLVCMHCAICEVGIVYATASVHSGWQTVLGDGLIEQTTEIIGGHAFAIVGYDESGFWIQNSWGSDYGRQGFCHITYDDWLTNGTDVWVARLGVPLRIQTNSGLAKAALGTASRAESQVFVDLRPHVISVGNDGLPLETGPYGNDEATIRQIIRNDLPRITQNWTKRRVLLYAHGGLNDEAGSLKVLGEVRADLLQNEVYPISFIWHTDIMSTLKDILEDALRRRTPAGGPVTAMDFMLDRIDDVLEPVVRGLGKLGWDEMKKNGILATKNPHGAARLVANELNELMKGDPTIEIHLLCHSAGSIFHAPFAQLLATNGAIGSGPMAGEQGLGHQIATTTFFAPACTTRLFKEAYVPLMLDSRLGDTAIYALTDKLEQDDNCVDIYHKSLLYLVSNAFEDVPRIPLIRDGVPILGMQKFIERDRDIAALFPEFGTTPASLTTGSLILSGKHTDASGTLLSQSAHHGDFDDDEKTRRSTLMRILGTLRAPQGATPIPAPAI